MRYWLVVLAACGRIGFDPLGSFRTCELPSSVVAMNLGDTTTGRLCPGQTDTYEVYLAAGDELEVELRKLGPGMPALEMRDAVEIREQRTFEPTLTGFAARRGTQQIIVSGIPAAEGTPYELTVRKRAGRYFYVSPSGDELNPGTAYAPWRRLDTSIAKLAPGDVLVLFDGVYTPAAHGRVDITCGTTAVSGTSSEPIRITALSERRAKIAGDGMQQTVLVETCQWWTIERLHVEGADLAGSLSGGAMQISRSQNITIRRVLAAYNNRYANTHLIDVVSSMDSLVEECEVYDFHRSGVIAWDSQRITFRRNYASSRATPDLVGGYVSIPADKGDVGIELGISRSSLAENNIEEGNGTLSVSAAYDVDAVDNRLFGNVTLGNDVGFASALGDTGLDNNINTHAEQLVTIGAADSGQAITSSLNFSCTGCTMINNGTVGWFASQNPVQPRPNASARCTACLSAFNSTHGFFVENQGGGWQLDHVNSFGNATPFEPVTAPEMIATTAIDPQLGGCLVYLPAASPMRGAGPNGSNIGAHLVYRYRDGVLGDIPLWDPETGAFPCGAIVAGVNDDPTTSCSGVHTRLHVGTPDCALPY